MRTLNLGGPHISKHRKHDTNYSHCNAYQRLHPAELLLQHLMICNVLFLRPHAQVAIVQPWIPAISHLLHNRVVQYSVQDWTGAWTGMDRTRPDRAGSLRSSLQSNFFRFLIFGPISGWTGGPKMSFSYGRRPGGTVVPHGTGRPCQFFILHSCLNYAIYANSNCRTKGTVVPSKPSTPAQFSIQDRSGLRSMSLLKFGLRSGSVLDRWTLLLYKICLLYTSPSPRD